MVWNKKLICETFRCGWVLTINSQWNISITICAFKTVQQGSTVICLSVLSSPFIFSNQNLHEQHIKNTITLSGTTKEKTVMLKFNTKSSQMTSLSGEIKMKICHVLRDYASSTALINSSGWHNYAWVQVIWTCPPTADYRAISAHPIA